MKIKNNTTSKVKSSTIVAILAVGVLSFFVLYTNPSTQTSSSKKIDINNPTVIKNLTVDYESLVTSSEYRLYNDSDVSVYLVNKSGTPKIVYAYKGTLEGREISDNFFLHIYIKDSTRLKGNAKFANSDFFQIPKVITVNGTTYHMFQKDLSSRDYVGTTIPIKDIKYLNTGRFKPGVDRSLDLKKIIPQDIPVVELYTGLDSILIYTKKKDFEKLRKKRDEAIEIGVLSSGNDDLIKGDISFNGGEKNPMEFRLKGDWPDHLLDEKKWSYRIIMDNEATTKGMRKFSIQHPKVRNYLWEWLYNKVLKDQGIIGLRYDFVDVHIKIKDDTATQDIPVGIMALEESFDKILIENNKKREGLILAFDESLFWGDTKKEQHFNLDHNTYSKPLRDLKNAPIRVFNENKVLSDPNLSKQFNTAKDLLEGLRQEKYKISEVFDLDKLTTFVALSYLFGGNHALVWHNLRIYYNPITGKLEPISYDSNSGLKLENMRPFPFSESDPLYEKELLKKLQLVSSSDYIDGFMSTYTDDLNRYRLALYAEYLDFFDESVLEYNSNYIKKLIQPAAQITPSLISYTDTSMSIGIQNLAAYPIVIKDLSHKDGRKLSVNPSVEVIATGGYKIVDFELNTSFINAFVSKKNKKGAFQYPKDVQKLVITHHLDGLKLDQQTPISPYGKNEQLDESIIAYKKFRTPNFDQFNFIEKTKDSLLSFTSGKHTLSQNLIIPPGYKIIISPGFYLDIKNNASIISNASITAVGTEENPIVFDSSDNTGGGIFITNASATSKLTHCRFNNLSNPNSAIWSVSGAVNFHESDVTITHTTFSSNRCEDGLNIIRSSFTMTDTAFKGTQSDAFDGDFVTGTLERCTFINSGNDGIDVSGSSLTLKDITIKNPSDKAISAGENSTITGENINVSGGEIGVVSKDLSKINLTNLRIIDTRLGISAFQKKSEYGVASIQISKLTLQNNELDYLIENRSSLVIDNVAVKTVSNNVIDQMYGKEYGKSSR